MQIYSKRFWKYSKSIIFGNISKDWSVDNIKKTGFNGYVYYFIVDYDATDGDDISDIHKYLTKKMPELVLILFITIGLWLKMFRTLNLIIVLKQQFTKLVNGRSQTKLTLKIELIIFTTT